MEELPNWGGRAMIASSAPLHTPGRVAGQQLSMAADRNNRSWALVHRRGRQRCLLIFSGGGRAATAAPAVVGDGRENSPVECVACTVAPAPSHGGLRFMSKLWRWPRYRERRACVTSAATRLEPHLNDLELQPDPAGNSVEIV